MHSEMVNSVNGSVVTIVNGQHHIDGMGRAGSDSSSRSRRSGRGTLRRNRKGTQEKEVIVCAGQW